MLVRLMDRVDVLFRETKLFLSQPMDITDALIVLQRFVWKFHAVNYPG